MNTSGQFKRIQLTNTQRDEFGRINTLAALQKLDHHDFARYSAYLYESRGYQAFASTAIGDEDVDLLLKKDGKLVVVQCDRTGSTVEQHTVTDLFETMQYRQADGAALITTGFISASAQAWAQDKPLYLVDGAELLKWGNLTRQNQGVGNKLSAWFTRNQTKLGIGLALIMALTICGVTLNGAFRVFSQRTTDDAPVLAVPTRSVTSEPVAEAELDLAPTATLLPTPTPAPELINSAEFTITSFESEPDVATWQALPAITLSHISERKASWDGQQDISAQWRMGYDNNFLYGFVVVEDDTHVQTETARTAYLGDSLELELDTSHDKATNAASDDFQYVISPGNFADLPPEAFRFRGGDNGVMNDEYGTNSEVTATKTDTGYIIAFKIPWFDLWMNRPPEGATIGVALSVNDNDSAETPQQEFALSNVPTRRWSNPSTWGTMTLR